MRILLILLSLTFAAELEVDGNLKVTGGIDAQGQPITNVGNPVNPTDAVPMGAVGGVVSNMMSLSGMTPPERIYRFQNNQDVFSFTVPDGKIWLMNVCSGMITFQGETLVGNPAQGACQEIILFSNDIFLSRSDVSTTNNKIFLTIFEYSVTSSGTSQGLDYVEP